MWSKVKIFVILFVVQLVLYTTLVFNFRAVAQGNIFWSGATDLTIAAINFFLVRKIANTPHLYIGFAGYVSGSVVGTIIGILISKFLLGW